MTRAHPELDPILDLPWEVLDYERWVSERTETAEDYLFAESRARFEARDEDRLRAAPDLRALETKGELRLSSERLGGGVPVRGVKRGAAERLLSLVDGRRTIAELRVLSGSDRPSLERLLTAGLGSVLFLPEAVAELERRISGAELVRFVGAPYELVRNYWSNMAAVRATAEREVDAAADVADFLRLLRRLHVLALLGEDLRTFYRPSSRITRRGVQPGRLYTVPARVLHTEHGTLLLEGPRVGITTAGGHLYHQAVYEAAGDSAALSPARALVDVAGLPWGEAVTGRALDEREDKAWFCPPRPIRPEHWSAIHAAFRGALDAAATGDFERCVEALSRFHHRFVRLHPFRCANQSLVMNLVNLVLARVRGAGIPHLLLDQFALRLEESAHVRLFRLAVETHCIGGRPEERWSILAERKARAYALIERFQQARDTAAARQLVAQDPEAARYALIRA